MLYQVVCGGPSTSPLPKLVSMFSKGILFLGAAAGFEFMLLSNGLDCQIIRMCQQSNKTCACNSKKTFMNEMYKMKRQIQGRTPLTT